MNSSQETSTQEKCSVCGEPAQYCIRGIPEDKYCEECAEELFQLDSLDKL